MCRELKSVAVPSPVPNGHPMASRLVRAVIVGGSAAAAALILGTGEPGAGIASIDGPSTTWNNCVGPLGLELDPHGVGPWALNANSYAGGVATGNISNITANITNPDDQCSFTVTGTVDATYTNSSQNLTVIPNPTLNISGV